MAAVLYLTWDGPNNAYLESLFLPIFARLPHRVHVLQLSYGDAGDAARTAQVAERLGIDYTRVAVPRWRVMSASTAAGVAVGIRALRRHLRRTRAEVLIPRSTIPALIALNGAADVPILFDADGLAQDERVDFAGWSPQGTSYRVMRDAEMRILLRASAVVTRTEATKRILLARAGPTLAADRVRVVPNGKDEAVFRPAGPQDRAAFRTQVGLPVEAPVVVYCGSMGPQYQPAAIMAFFKHVRARRPGAHLVVLTGHEADARAEAETAGLPPEAVTIRRVPPDEVPRYLAAADVGLAFRQPSFSQLAVCPIKVGEYLLSGLPVVANAGVGDLDVQLADCRGAFVGEAVNPGSIERAAAWFLDSVEGRDEARTAARDRGVLHFSLGQAVAGYDAAIDAAI